jgi:hypothetical protein
MTPSCFSIARARASFGTGAATGMLLAATIPSTATTNNQERSQPDEDV